MNVSVLDFFGTGGTHCSHRAGKDQGHASERMISIQHHAIIGHFGYAIDHYIIFIAAFGQAFKLHADLQFLGKRFARFDLDQVGIVFAKSVVWFECDQCFKADFLTFERFFDFLGELELVSPLAPGETVVWPHYYKQLREESGGVVYAEPRFAEFLRAEYDRLFLPRQVRETAVGDGSGDDSVLSVDFEHRRSLATLRLLASGGDLADNLAAHLALLAREKIANVLVEVDCGRGEEIAFVAALYDAGFRPRLLIPDAGRGDLVVFAR